MTDASFADALASSAVHELPRPTTALERRLWAAAFRAEESLREALGNPRAADAQLAATASTLVVCLGRYRGVVVQRA
ncbi:MAG TPA: hypothetical protein VHE78_01265 [Gemmatimonadaceae bacterium]|jgi:hypothetical protein|nr:hypothetical protein [Gemmatimonadaceae bacterium]